MCAYSITMAILFVLYVDILEEPGITNELQEISHNFSVLCKLNSLKFYVD